MPGFLISTFGFLLLFLSDYLQGRKFSRKAVVPSIVGYGCVLFVIVLMAGSGNASVPLPAGVISGWILSLLFAALLVYSVLVEIPLLSRKYRLKPKEVLQKGTYGLCRHPGFLWFLLLMLSLFLIHQNTRYLVLSGYMVVLNFVLVLTEDRFLFPRIFSDYDDYRKNVPFLLPFRRVSGWR